MSTAESALRIKSQREHDRLENALLQEQIANVRKQRESQANAWNGYRKFVIDRKVDEADGICSFYLKPHDAKPLPSFLPGQYLTFRMNIPGREKPVVRCYSLSDRPRPDRFRVSIKRSLSSAPNVPPGLVSNFFHEQLAEGDLLDIQAPRGQFALDPDQQRPCVLIAGGVGITPMVSMIQSIVESGSGREVLLFYGLRDGSEHAFRDTLKRLTETHESVRMVVAYSQPTTDDEKHEGHDYHHNGWVDIELIRSYLSSTNYEFYLCGPPGMMDTLNQKLIRWGVAESAINAEAFGPATITQTTAKTASTNPNPKATATAVAGPSVEFSRAGKSCSWNSEMASLLDLADDNGIQIDSGCRAGNCGSCSIAIKSGKVKYLCDVGADIEDGTCLACVAIPDGDLVIDA